MTDANTRPEFVCVFWNITTVRSCSDLYLQRIRALLPCHCPGSVAIQPAGTVAWWTCCFLQPSDAVTATSLLDLRCRVGPYNHLDEHAIENAETMTLNVHGASVLLTWTAVRLTVVLLWNPESTPQPLLLNQSTGTRSMHWHLAQDRCVCEPGRRVSMR